MKGFQQISHKKWVKQHSTIIITTYYDYYYYYESKLPSQEVGERERERERIEYNSCTKKIDCVIDLPERKWREMKGKGQESQVNAPWDRHAVTLIEQCDCERVTHAVRES